MTSIVTARINYWDKIPAGYVVFNIEVSFRGSNWVIEKRFNDFVTLHQGLSREFRDTDLGPLPKRRFFNRFDPDFLNERSQDLQAFLGRALVKIQVTNSDSMLNFLEVGKNVQFEAPDDDPNSDYDDLVAEYEERETQRLEDLVQTFQDRMIDSQSVRVEPRNDVEVEARRQKLLQACNGFREHDDHLKKFLNPSPNPQVQNVDQAIDTVNFVHDQNFENNVVGASIDLSSKLQTSALTQTQYHGGHGLVTSMGNI
ncbi:unnamed protein product [Ectocarpus sp. 12 AP-2014]